METPYRHLPEGRLPQAQKVLARCSALVLWLSLAITGQSQASPDTAAFDHEHQAWSQILSQIVHSEGATTRVNYQQLLKDQQLFRQYLQQLEAVTEAQYQQFSKAQRLAFLINTYNARQIQLIVDNYPLDSVKDLGFLFYTPWKKPFFMFLGEEQSLDHVEHEVIRKQFQEPRIHFAVNCASIGCPPLRNEAYTAAKLEYQLEQNTFLFINNTAHNGYAADKQLLLLSPIFDWYGEDFGTRDELLRFVSNYMTQLNSTDKVKNIRYSHYDWGLNEIKTGNN